MSEVTGLTAMMRRYRGDAEKYVEEKIREREVMLRGIKVDTDDTEEEVVEVDELAREELMGNGKAAGLEL